MVSVKKQVEAMFKNDVNIDLERIFITGQSITFHTKTEEDLKKLIKAFPRGKSLTGYSTNSYYIRKEDIVKQFSKEIEEDE